MWSVLAEAIEIEREKQRIFPAVLPSDLSARRVRLAMDAAYLGIDLELETKWLPAEDMTAEQAADELAHVNRALDAWEQQKAVLRKSDLPIDSAITDFTAYRDRLLDVVRA